MGQHLSPRYSQVILVNGYPVLTAVNWSQHWYPMDVCIISFSVLSNKLESMRLNIDCDLVKQLVSGQLPNKSRHLDELTHEPAIWSCKTGQWISCLDNRQLTINFLWMSNIQDVDLLRPHLNGRTLRFRSNSKVTSILHSIRGSMITGKYCLVSLVWVLSSTDVGFQPRLKITVRTSL